MDERDQLAARAAAANEQEAARLAEQLDQGRTAVSAAQAGPKLPTTEPPAQEAARKAADRAAETEASLSSLQVEVAKAQAAVGSATQWAASVERLLEQARADLQAERDRHDASLSQLHGQLAQLIAGKPTGAQRPRAPQRRRGQRPLRGLLITAAK